MDIPYFVFLEQIFLMKGSFQKYLEATLKSGSVATSRSPTMRAFVVGNGISIAVNLNSNKPDVAKFMEHDI